MSLPEFYELWFFDTFIEPQGPQMDDFYQARLTHSIFANNPNLTKEGRKKLNMKDFYMMKEKVFKSKEELEQERKRIEEANKEKMKSMFDPKLLAKAQAKANRNKK
ncbi:hypothetical protein QEF67_000020 [Klebsiella aerogenes]|uniref:hypothetical protein n=1 Tax=Klebsiella aerogenes TaxID=548 RepID=UPI0007354D6E|nr:hypothetical protein [Klebsiella aerogenes]EKT3979542.1 hypothetical protein [Klebsiella aerogenes]KTH33883.1 hypothetical protein ASV26_08660 [Klebsiella aerogenes]MCY4762666.1 hypothetical protein [Klebsiella aerogenes]MDT4308382.1 hypothetical protein [Klebsiella aerogenes]PLC39120.1 hypothetical protein C0Q87_02725 [Klebsiella aerogenes]